MKRYLVVITILALVAVLATGCAGAPSMPTPTPTPSETPAPVPTPTGEEVNFRLLISDELNAIEFFEYLDVIISSIGVHQGGESGTWHEPPVISDDPDGDGRDGIDLTQLQGENALVLWEGTLPEGEYTKVFIYISGINYELKTGGTADVKLPSDKLQISKPFTISSEDGQVVNFVFDVTVIKAGESGKYIMKPQIGESGADQNFTEVPPSGRAGKSNIGHLYLREKDPNTWEIIDGGAWGKMKYNLSGSTFDFVFNGHGLEVGDEYTLIYYPDPWPGDDLICLGSRIANEDGDVHIMGRVDTGDLPTDEDANYPTGAKIWLVLSGDVQCQENEDGPHMIGWNPTEYLFEYDLITFDDTDVDTDM